MARDTKCKEIFGRCDYEKVFEDNGMFFPLAVCDIDYSAGGLSGDDIYGVQRTIRAD